MEKGWIDPIVVSRLFTIMNDHEPNYPSNGRSVSQLEFERLRSDLKEELRGIKEAIKHLDDRLDRLAVSEAEHKTKTKVLWGLYTVGISGLVTAAYAVIRGLLGF